ncbi:transcription initiation protein SPT3 homolog [Liolophura sinensis]|uniref:transcription initiation protein SPT3 homolog n=1 Tax=Liolophura sinensis TaxID=3198878 RepID=UPI00315958A9
MSSGNKAGQGSASHHGNTSSSHTSSSTARNSFIQWFTTEIQQMMHGFGDSRRPLLDSAMLVEELVHQQMTTIAQQAAGVAMSRNARFIGIEDFLFLLRKDKVKLRRLLRYMMLKDKTATLKSSQDEEEGNETGEKLSQPLKKRTKMCQDFLSNIDQTGELVALFEDDGLDEVKHDRLLRAELLTRSMTPTQYLEFCEARQVTFCRKFKSHRFKEWLLTGLHLEVKPNALALEVLSYLAYETVAQIVDLSLLVKQDQSKCVEEPVSASLPTICMNYQDTVQFPAGSSPPSTPTQSSVNSGGSNPASHQSSQSSHSSTNAPHSSSKNHPRREKGRWQVFQSCLSFHCCFSFFICALFGVTNQGSGVSTVLEWSASNTILPSDIREAMRRYSHCFGPFSGLTKRDFSSEPLSKLLCC